MYNRGDGHIGRVIEGGWFKPVHNSQSSVSCYLIQVMFIMLFQDMENKIRNTLNEIYFGKTKDIVNGLRQVMSISYHIFFLQQSGLKQKIKKIPNSECSFESCIDQLIQNKIYILTSIFQGIWIKTYMLEVLMIHRKNLQMLMNKEHQIKF